MLKGFCAFDYSDASGNRSHRDVFLLSVSYQDDGKVPPHFSILAFDFDEDSVRRFKAHNCFNIREADMGKICQKAAVNLSEIDSKFVNFLIYKENGDIKVTKDVNMAFVAKMASNEIEVIGVF